MRVTDVFLALPQLVLALALAQLLTPSLESAMMALALTYWPFFTRLVFAETRRLQASLFVDALRGIGAGSARILFLHILPNAMSPVIVRATIGHGLHDPGRRGPRLSRHGRDAAGPRLGPDHRRKPQLPAATPGGIRPFPAWRSWSPCWASTCSATGCATSSTRGCGGRGDERPDPRNRARAEGCRSAPTRASRRCSTYRFRARTRPHPRASSASRAAASRRSSARSSASCRGAPGSRPARSASTARICSAFSEARAQPPHPRQPHRLHPAGPVSGVEPGVQGRDAAAGDHALARADEGAKSRATAQRRHRARIGRACCGGCNCPIRRRRWSAIRTSSPAASGSAC